MRKGVDCSTRANKALHAGGLVPPPVAVPLPAPARDSVAGACALPGRLYQLPDDMAAASGFVAAASAEDKTLADAARHIIRAFDTCSAQNFPAAHGYLSYSLSDWWLFR